MNEYAFPNPALADESYRAMPSDYGMTLRDWFAGQALAMVDVKNINDSAKDIATAVYLVADAMLAARNNNTENKETV